VRLILVRHGETVWNAEGRYQGATDLPLSAQGKAQAQCLADRLALESIDLVYSSDLKRARQTASAIAACLGLQVHREPRLREMAFGDWEGLTYSEIRERHPQALARWEDDPVGTAPPGGESLSQLVARIKDLLDDLRGLGLGEAGTALLVSHGGPLRVFLGLALGLAPGDYWRFRLDPGSISDLHLYPECAILNLLNDRHHLAEGDCGR